MAYYFFTELDKLNDQNYSGNENVKLVLSLNLN